MKSLEAEYFRVEVKAAVGILKSCGCFFQNPLLNVLLLTKGFNIFSFRNLAMKPAISMLMIQMEHPYSYGLLNNRRDNWYKNDKATYFSYIEGWIFYADDGDTLQHGGCLIMGNQTEIVRYRCTSDTFISADTSEVRWLIPGKDTELMDDYLRPRGFAWLEEDWVDALKAGYSYCAVIKDNKIVSTAAVWKYSEGAWEVAAVHTLDEYQRRGLGAKVVSFVAQYILENHKIATCTTRADNMAMRKTAESVGFYLV